MWGLGEVGQTARAGQGVLLAPVPRMGSSDWGVALLCMSLAQRSHHILHTHGTTRRAQNAPCKRLYSPDTKITPSQLYNANSTAEVSNAHRVFALRVSTSTLPSSLHDSNHSAHNAMCRRLSSLPRLVCSWTVIAYFW